MFRSDDMSGLRIAILYAFLQVSRALFRYSTDALYNIFGRLLVFYVFSLMKGISIFTMLHVKNVDMKKSELVLDSCRVVSYSEKTF